MDLRRIFSCCNFHNLVVLYFLYIVLYGFACYDTKQEIFYRTDATFVDRVFGILSDYYRFFSTCTRDLASAMVLPTRILYITVQP